MRSGLNCRTRLTRRASKILPFFHWLGPLQSGEVTPGSMAAYGSIEGHVHAAVRVLQVMLQSFFNGLSYLFQRDNQGHWKSFGYSQRCRHAQSNDYLVSTPNALFQALPNMGSRNVNGVFRLLVGNFVIIRTDNRTFIGEVLDIYKKGMSNRYASIESADSLSQLAAVAVHAYLPLYMVSWSYF